MVTVNCIHGTQEAWLVCFNQFNILLTAVKHLLDVVKVYPEQCLSADIIFIMLQGHTLFQTHDNLEHLAMMNRILGDFPSHMVRRTKTSFFHPGTNRLCWDWSVPAARYASQHCRPLPQYRRHSPHHVLGQEESVMLDLIARMLEYEPDRRMILKEALRHPFFDRLSVFQKLEDVSKHILRLQI